MNNYWAYYGWRWIVVALFGWMGYSQSGWEGAFWGVITLGIFAFIIYTAMDAWGSLTRAFTRPQNLNQSVNFNTVVVEDEAIKGQPHRDPTRPAMTTDDYMALIESYKHRKG